MKYGTLIRLADPRDAEPKMRQLRECGLDCCQLVYKPERYEAEDAEIIKEASLKTGVEISAQFCGFRDQYATWNTKSGFLTNGINSPLFAESRLAYLLSAIPFIKKLGITDMIIHAGFIPNNPFDDSYGRMLSAMTMLCGHLKNNGLNLLLETGTDSPISMLRLIEEVGTGNIYVNLDTGNLIMYGYGNPIDALHTYGRLVRNTHFKDGLPPTVPGALGKETEIGSGNVDFKKVISILKSLGYDRYITIERELSGGNQSDEIIRALSYIRDIWDNG